MLEPIRKRAHTQRQGTVDQSIQLAEPLWTDPGPKSGISVRELNSNEKKKKAGGKWIVEHSPKIFAREEKAITTTIR